MNKLLQVSKDIPPNAKILLVDVEYRYFQDTYYDLDKRIKRNVGARVQRMAAEVKGLINSGHEVYAIIDFDDGGRIFPELTDFPITQLPKWNADTIGPLSSPDPINAFVLEPEIMAAFKKDDVIVVAGLWREWCVYAVTRLLNENGYNAILSLNDDLCFQRKIVWAGRKQPTLPSKCKEANIKIKHVRINNTKECQ